MASAFRISGLNESLRAAINDRIGALVAMNFAKRIFEKDHTLWRQDPTEISNRLGWIDSPATMTENIDEINSFVESLRLDGIKQMLLLGMGGSSMAPEVYRFTHGFSEGYLDLKVLDSTDPQAVRNARDWASSSPTCVLTSTKSGGTVETLSFMKYFYNCLDGDSVQGERSSFAAVTDPGSKLQTMAETLGFRKTFINDPNIGGRFSGLSYFGLVPAAAVGIDLANLLARTTELVDEFRGNASESNSSLWFGAMMSECAAVGRDKLTLITAPDIQKFGAWAEQLVAESLGKDGKGILPVDLEPLASPAHYGSDRFFVFMSCNGQDAFETEVAEFGAAGYPVASIVLDDAHDLGAEFFRWEIATATAGVALNVNPFDQPNVESAKIAAREVVTSYTETGVLPEEQPLSQNDDFALYGDGAADDPIAGFLAHCASADVNNCDYISIHAYLTPGPELDAALCALQAAIRDKDQVATTCGYGPRFLHSTGQLHKGDSGKGKFIQFTQSVADEPIPDQPAEATSSMGFQVLISSQALGDAGALRKGGRPTIRLHITGDPVRAIGNLVTRLREE